MNMVGTFGASLSQGFIAMFTEWREGLGYSIRQQWDPAFYVYVGVLFLGAMCWSAYRSQLVVDDGMATVAGPHGDADESLPLADTFDE
jgi:hypothetical protein